jgi:hypothetical protein
MRQGKQSKTNYMGKKDFFDDVANAVNENPDEVKEDKIKIGEKEYTEDELSQLVGLGQTARELESKWNTKVDSLMPEYTKSRQELKDWKEKYEAQQKQLEEMKGAQNVQPTGALSEEQKEAVRKQLKDLGVVITGDLDNWYATRRQAEKLLEDMDDMAGEISGTDGRPKFVTQEILDYMMESGIKKPMDAYELKYKQQLKDWEKTQVNATKEEMFTSTPTGESKTPREVRPTKDNLNELVREALTGATQE